MKEYIALSHIFKLSTELAKDPALFYQMGYLFGYRGEELILLYSRFNYKLSFYLILMSKYFYLSSFLFLLFMFINKCLRLAWIIIILKL